MAAFHKWNKSEWPHDIRGRPGHGAITQHPFEVKFRGLTKQVTAPLGKNVIAKAQNGGALLHRKLPDRIFDGVASFVCNDLQRSGTAAPAIDMDCRNQRNGIAAVLLFEIPALKIGETGASIIRFPL